MSEHSRINRLIDRLNDAGISARWNHANSNGYLITETADPETGKTWTQCFEFCEEEENDE